MRAVVLSALVTSVVSVAACYAPTYEGLLCGEAADPCPEGFQCVNNACLEDEGRCGDGVRSGGEACDDGNTMTETACVYGMATCAMCNGDCTQALNLTGRFCGDRLVETGIEVCDDGNAMACGSCTADCTANLVPTAPTGMLINVALLTAAAHEGQNFGLFDGVLPNYLGFEIDVNGTVQPTFVRVDIATNPPVAAVIQAINGSAVSITASDAGGGNVRLINQFQNGRGNGPITTNIGSPFEVSGMSGGAGSDCPQGVGCTSNGVCTSNACTNNVCQ